MMEQLCANGEYDPELWVVNLRGSRDNDKAVAICRACPYMERCEQEAKAMPVHLMRSTIWAGRRWDVDEQHCRGCGNAPDGARLTADNFCGSPCRQNTLCGTGEGYTSHTRWRTIPCDACCEKAGRERPVYPVKTCAYCLDEFEIPPRTTNKDFCSVLCRIRMQAITKAMRVKIMAMEPTKTLDEVTWLDGMEVQCRNVECDAKFVYVHTHPLRRYCTTSCAKGAWRNRLREATARGKSALAK